MGGDLLKDTQLSGEPRLELSCHAPPTPVHSPLLTLPNLDQGSSVGPQIPESPYSTGLPFSGLPAHTSSDTSLREDAGWHMCRDLAVVNDKTLLNQTRL